MTRQAVSRVGISRAMSSHEGFAPTDQFIGRHVGSQGRDKQIMLEKVGFKTIDDLVDSTVPKAIRLHQNLNLDEPMSESEALSSLKGIMGKNKVLKSFIGMGYYETLTPSVILRNVSININCTIFHSSTAYYHA